MSGQTERELIPARGGKAKRLSAGQSIRIINTHGHQVVDTWAFNAGNLQEFLSMEHMRAALDRICPRPGDVLVTNHRRPILTFLEDTSPGVHDTLIAACDIHRYRGLGVTGVPSWWVPKHFRTSRNKIALGSFYTKHS